MFSMVMTLEVSKLSGWLNADASCRESKGGHAVCMGRGMRVGRRGGGGRRRLKERAGQGLTADYRGKALGGAHPEHVAHVRDAGGVEAQRLVKRRRALPRVERRAYGVGCGRQAVGAVGDRGASSV